MLPWPWRAVLKGHQLKHPSCTSNPAVQNSTMRPWFPFPMVSQSKPHALHENLSVETSSQTRGCSMHNSSRCPRQMEQEEVPKGHDLIEHCVPLRAIACHCVPLRAIACHCVPLRYVSTCSNNMHHPKSMDMWHSTLFTADHTVSCSSLYQNKRHQTTTSV